MVNCFPQAHFAGESGGRHPYLCKSGATGAARVVMAVPLFDLPKM